MYVNVGTYTYLPTSCDTTVDVSKIIQNKIPLLLSTTVVPLVYEFCYAKGHIQCTGNDRCGQLFFVLNTLHRTV